MAAETKADTLYDMYHFSGEAARCMPGGKPTFLCALPRPAEGRKHAALDSLKAFTTWSIGSKALKITCLLCDAELSKDQSNNLRHFQHKHLWALPPEEQDKYRSHLASKGRAADSVAPASSAAEAGTKRPRGTQLSIASFVAPRDLATAAAIMVAVDFMPLSALEKPGLRFLLRYLGTDPDEEAPSRRTITRRVDSLYADMLACVQSIAKELRAAGALNFTMDAWTAGSHHGMVGVTISGVDKDFKPRSAALGFVHVPGSHDGKALRAAAMDAITSTGLPADVPFTMVADGASNQAAAFADDEQVSENTCGAHLLDNAIEAACEIIKAPLDDMSWLISRLLGSPLLLSVLDALGIKRLVRAAATRWSSVYYMMSRFVEVHDVLKPALPQLLAQIKVKCDKDAFKVKFNQALSHVPLFHLILPTLEVAAAEQQALATRDKPTISCFPTLFTRIIGVIDEQFTLAEGADFDTTLAINMLMTFKKEVRRRLSEHMENNLIRIASCLDPRFAIEALGDADAISWFEAEMERLDAILSAPAAAAASASVPSATMPKSRFAKASAAAANNGAIKPEIATFMKLMEDLERQPPAARAAIHPWEWWAANASTMPHIAAITRRVLSIPATSADSERLFSRAGIVDAERRRRLTPKHLSQLTLLSLWLQNTSFPESVGMKSFVPLLPSAHESEPVRVFDKRALWPSDAALALLNATTAGDDDLVEDEDDGDAAGADADVEMLL
jgi:hypothetical protein